MENIPKVKTTIDLDEIYRDLKNIVKMNYEEKVSALKNLLRVPIPGVRTTIEYIASTIFKEDTIVDMLKNDADDILRNTAMEIIKHKGEGGLSLALKLFNYPDNDVVLSAILIADSFKDKRVVRPLLSLLNKTNDTNIKQAGIIALGNTKDKRVINEVVKYLEDDFWLQTATINALGEIGDKSALKYLEPLLENDMLSSFAVEAIAKINEKEAFKLLIDYWLKNKDLLDKEHFLEHICNVTENNCFEIANKTFIEDLERLLAGTNQILQFLSARILLSTGYKSNIKDILQILLLSYRDENLPLCLEKRFDLMEEILEINNNIALKWALILAKKNVSKLDENKVSKIIKSLGMLVEINDFDQDHLNLLIELLTEYRNEKIAEDFFDLYIKVPFIERMFLNPLLVQYGEILPEIIKKKILDKKTKVVLDFILDNVTEESIKDFFSFQLGRIKSILPYVILNEKTFEKIPLGEYLEKNPEEAINILSVFASKYNFEMLLPKLREILSLTENPDLIRIMGLLKDKESLSRIIELTNSDNELVKSISIESLGKLCSKPAKDALIKILSVEKDTKILRIAFQAFCNCADEEDLDFIKDNINNSDWYIRFILIDVLTKIKHPAINEILLKLTLDPFKTVSEKAKMMLNKRTKGSER